MKAQTIYCSMIFELNDYHKAVTIMINNQINLTEEDSVILQKRRIGASSNTDAWYMSQLLSLPIKGSAKMVAWELKKAAMGRIGNGFTQPPY